MINFIWFFLLVVGICYSFISGNGVSEVILSSGNDTYELLLHLGPLIVLWSGVLNIANKSGLLKIFKNILRPFLDRLLPSIKGEKAKEFVSLNIAANMLGLGSVATPSGLKAMEEMQNENKDKEVASEGMISFLVLNTSGVTIIPMSVIALRMMYQSSNVMKIVIPSIIATIVSSIGGLLLDYYIRRRNAK